VAGAAPTTPTAMAALLLEEVPTVLAVLLLEIPTTSTTSRCSDPAAWVESTIEADRIHHLEVPTASTPL
jgi:hypothetical protein